MEKFFPQEVESLVEKYTERLGKYAVYAQTRNEVGELIPNPKMEPVLQVLTKVPPDRAERSILAFLRWYKTQDANRIKCKYKSLASAIANDWELSQ